jgi:tRNA(Ile)-lysidine synthase
MIKKLYDEFENSFSNLLKENNIQEDVFAIAVSGGADSLALCFLCDKWAKTYNKKIVALTVDHKLREESAYEAEFVHKLLLKNNIEHHVLLWEGDKPENGLEEKARIARYDLLIDFCNKQGIKSILLAHHKKDQAETFLMRLQRGSGVDGLSAISPVFYKDNIKLVRPLLNIMPEKLKDYLSERKVSWFEDPMNEDEDFLRVKFRKNLGLLEKEFNISIDCLVNTAENMARARDYLEGQTKKNIDILVKWDNRGFAKMNKNKFCELHDEIAYRVLSKVLIIVGGSIYTPRFTSLDRLYNEIKQDVFVTQTLNGVKIKLEKQNICFYREIAKVEKKEVINKEFVFDNRFLITLNKVEKGTYIDILGEEGWKSLLKVEPKYKNKKINYDIKTNLLALKDKNSQIIEVFEFGYCKTSKIFENISFKPLACSK